MALYEPPPDDFELSDLENEAFIPNHGNTTHRHTKQRSSQLTGWIPPRARKFVLSFIFTHKLWIILLLALVTILALLFWMTDGPTVLKIPSASVTLSAQLAEGFAGTSIPAFVFACAPLVVLEKSDRFSPGDLANHIINTHPTSNFAPVDSPGPGLDDLDYLNTLGGETVYLTSNEKLDSMPSYLEGQAPDLKTLKTENAVTAVIFVVEKPEGIIDAFYMYFYTFNEGPNVFGHAIGNHLGDWEHNMIRFKDGIPTEIWYSQHEYGEAYLWNSVEKLENRPLSFSAKGSHANYATRGKHDLHNGENVVFDYTSNGRLWDPTLAAYYYTYSTETKKFTPVTESHETETPVNFLYFEGRWGDQEYTDDMPEQSSFQGFHKWNGGPQGPWFKHLNREDVCLPHGVPCEIKDSI